MHLAKFHIKLLALPFAASELQSSPVWSDDATDKAKLSRSADLLISNGENLQMIISPPICETGGFFSPDGHQRLWGNFPLGISCHHGQSMSNVSRIRIWVHTPFVSGSGRLELRPPTQSLCSSDSTSLQTSPASGFQNLRDSQIPVLPKSPSSRHPHSIATHCWPVITHQRLFVGHFPTGQQLSFWSIRIKLT